jgi:23S rRNA (guanine2445-N2)-methyltransferase / 23S rRNA (guanine2069-N7)-methyltransferase
MSLQFAVTCPRYLEELLQQELQDLGIEAPRQTIGAVTFEGSLAQAYRVCLWTRLGSRVLLQLFKGRAESRDDIYKACVSVDWLQHLSAEQTLAVDFIGRSQEIRNSQFGAQVVKDAVVDAFSDSGVRPSVDLKKPDIRINARLHKGELTVALDISGRSLHQRGYREHGGSAPLKENLAAAILIRAGWPQQMQQGDILLDPMCGSGTLLIEAALMASDTAPGLDRADWGFINWPGHDADAWQALLHEARERRKKALLQGMPEIRGFDGHPGIIRPARINAENAGVAELIDIQCRELASLTPPTHRRFNNALIVTNPPYGERLGEVEELSRLYRHFGQRLKERFANWRMVLITSNSDLASNLRLRADKKYRLRNGALDSELLLFTLAEDSADRAKRAAEADQAAELPIDEGLANRLRKNRQRLKKALRQIDSDCYRLYDADIPEFASAIDLYGDEVVVSEYAAPKSIDENTARQRFQLTLSTVAQVLEKTPEQVHAKRRERQTGKRQYERMERENRYFTVREGQARLRVNTSDFLDTGLFLDHRPLRRMIAQQAKGKRVLNLFCYTGSITVHAGLGGAAETTSIDMSKTYIDWAAANLRLNKLSGEKHTLLQADCLSWLEEADGQYDLIVLDPPSFSNSKRMDEVLDIQRDHAELIDACMRLLSAEGKLYFSTNKRRFRLEQGLGQKFHCTDITSKTLDPDFQRGSPIHFCWEISHITK